MTVTTDELGQLILLDLGKVEISPLNPRQDMGDLTELAASIKQIGVMEPIVVIERGGVYQTIAGSRRSAAARLAGKTQIPARVMSYDDAMASAAALIENLQRKDLNPMEQAHAFRSWLDLTGKPQAELAKAVGLAPSTIANALRLLEAPKPVTDALSAGTITAAHARVALELKDPALAGKLSLKADVPVRDVKDEVDRANREWAMTGGGAVAAAKAFVAKSQREHINATILWRQQPTWELSRVVDLMKALGKPPKSWRGVFAKPSESWRSQPTAEQHQKVCDCQAYEVGVREDGNTGGRLIFELERCCIVEAKYKKAKPQKKQARSSSSSAPKELTPAQIAAAAKKAHEEAAKSVTQEFKGHSMPVWGDAAVAKKVATLDWSGKGAHAIALMLLMATETFNLYHDEEQTLAAERIRSMSTAQAREFVLLHAGHQLGRQAGQDNRDGQAAAWVGIVRDMFGLKAPAPKAEKPAKGKAA